MLERIWTAAPLVRSLDHYGVRMRLDDYNHDEPQPLQSVGLGLTFDEARELHDALHSLLDQPEGNHVHVSSADYQTEITVFIIDETGELVGSHEPYRCPVCGFLGFPEAPWSEDGRASLEICPSCGVQFGYTDLAAGDTAARALAHDAWRARWIADGCPWRGAHPQPAGWDPAAQLQALERATQD